MMRTAQELFTTAVRGVLAQGEPSFVADRGCVYRGPNGKKCAIGFLLDDETARKGDEMLSSVNDLWQKGRLTAELNAHRKMLHQLQEAHDNPATDGETGAHFITSFTERARNVAKDFGLEFPE